MKVETDPRCPAHPRTGVYVAWRSDASTVPTWHCAACHRPLGAAALSLDSWGAPWPQGRRPTRRDLAEARVDWRWLFAQADRRRREAKRRKVTEFVGRASGDCECFCFDRRTFAESKRDDRDARDPDLPMEAQQARWDRDDAARVYPHALLPDGVSPDFNSPDFDPADERAGYGAYGRWRITVEFEPLEDP